MLRSTAPRAHADAAFLAAKRARLDEPHVGPLNALAVQVERTVRRPAPRVDPDSGGTGARVLLLLETPSTAAYGSGIVSLDDDDATSAVLWQALDDSGLDRRSTVLWNAVPWFTGTPERGAAPTAGELRLGQTWLLPFLTLLPRLAVVVALGRSAQTAAAPFSTATRALRGRQLRVLLAPSPDQRVDDGPGADGRDRVRAALTEAAEALRPERSR